MDLVGESTSETSKPVAYEAPPLMDLAEEATEVRPFAGLMDLQEEGGATPDLMGLEEEGKTKPRALPGLMDLQEDSPADLMDLQEESAGGFDASLMALKEE
jgi:hypothetical protein